MTADRDDLCHDESTEIILSHSHHIILGLGKSAAAAVVAAVCTVPVVADAAAMFATFRTSPTMTIR